MPIGVYIRTKPAWNKGRKLSSIHRANLSKSWKYEKHITKKVIEAARKVASIYLHTPQVSEKISKSLTGVKTGRVPKSAFKKGDIRHGKNHWNWKGGITPINRALRDSIEYEAWRTKVFERDLYTCQNCGEVGGRLEADHIKPWSLFPELRFVLSNGRTLCKPCHKKIGWNLFRENNPKKKYEIK